MSNTWIGSQNEKSGISWKLEGIMSTITELWMESQIVTRLDISVTNSLILGMSKKGMNGSWLQDPGMERKCEQLNKLKMEGK